MKRNFYKTTTFIVLCTMSLLPATKLSAQICTNPKDTLYGLSTTGVIVPININDGGVGPNIVTPGTAVNSNGAGYSPSGKFYFFQRSAAPTAPNQAFVAYDIVAKTTTTLTLPTLTTPATSKIRSGAVNAAGTAYYTIDPAFSGTNAELYYYNIATPAWVSIGSNFINAANTLNYNATFHSLNSGDMAFDGQGNLWILCSNSSNYALYEILAANVPTVATANIKVIEIIPSTAFVGAMAGHSITGLAFNNAGTLYLTTGTGDNKIYKLATATSSLVLVGTIAQDDAGADLTSCSYPMWVLSSQLMNFKATQKNGIELSWSGIEDEQATGYNVQSSADALNWNTIGRVERKPTPSGTTNNYRFEHNLPSSNENYYRVVQTSLSGRENISSVEHVNVATAPRIVVGPNPATNQISISNKDMGKYIARIFDGSGKLVSVTIVDQAMQTINISSLNRDTYFLKLTSTVNAASFSYQFVKM
jgi:hypothetical protein